MSNEEMCLLAKSLIKPLKLNKHAKIADTACVITTSQGNVYSGVSLVATCGLGYCSEQAAITQMLNSGETSIETIVVIDKFNDFLPPCGKCLELITQINDGNKQTNVILDNKIVKIKDLFTIDWKDIKDKRIS